MITVGYYKGIAVPTCGAFWDQAEADSIAEWYVTRIMAKEAA